MVESEQLIDNSLNSSHTLATFKDKILYISPREFDVLRLLLQGYTAKQTALALGISSRTVETYLDNIRKKAGCKSKLALIAGLKVNIDTNA